MDDIKNFSPVKDFLDFQEGERLAFFLTISSDNRKELDAIKTLMLDEGHTEYAKGIEAGYDWGMNARRSIISNTKISKLGNETKNIKGANKQENDLEL